MHMFLHRTYVAALLNFMVKGFDHWDLSSLIKNFWKKNFHKVWFYRRGSRSSREWYIVLNFKRIFSSCVDRMHSLKGNDIKLLFLVAFHSVIQVWGILLLFQSIMLEHVMNISKHDCFRCPASDGRSSFISVSDVHRKYHLYSFHQYT